MVYLDYASHTPADSIVLDEFIRVEKTYIGNPNSKHSAGRYANAETEKAAQKIAELLDVKVSEIIFTSGASEANNTAVKGLARAYRHYGKHILSTCLEHPSVSGALTVLQEQGYEIELINMLPNGTVDLEHFKELLRKDTVLTVICAVDSELGAIQPIEKIAEILKDYPNCHFHCDASQAVGKISFNFNSADCISFAPHKFYGLCGCGVLIKREGVIIEPLIHGSGGTGISTYRSGTPSPALTASICTALELSFREFEERYERVKYLRSYLSDVLKKYPSVRFNSPHDGSPYILNISVKNVKGDVFQKMLNERDIYVSVKSACSVSGTPSRSVFAVSGDKKNAMSSWRISLSHLTSKEETDYFLKAFDDIYGELVK